MLSTPRHSSNYSLHTAAKHCTPAVLIYKGHNNVEREGERLEASSKNTEVVALGSPALTEPPALEQPKKLTKHYGTRGSQVIPQPSTSRAQPRLTSEF